MNRAGHVVSNAGTRVAWKVVGEGPPTTILIMGLNCSSAFFFDFPHKLAALGETVLLVDNRGTGGSELPRRPFRMRDMADDVWRAADAAGADAVKILGTSMGGMIAQHAALQRPEQVRGLVLVCTSPGWPAFRAPRAGTFRAIARQPYRFEAPRPELLKDLLLAPGEKHRAEEIFGRWTEVWEERARPRATQLQVGAVMSHAAWRKLHRLECPVEIVHGTADPLLPYANARRLARRLKNAELTAVPGAGHVLIHVAPDVVLGAYERLGRRIG